MAVAQAAIDDFALWTGRPGVCVDEIRFVDLVATEDLRGRYQPEEDRIELQWGLEAEELRRLVFHELCHALDDLEELAPGRRALFAAGARAVDPARYPTERGRLSEAFAEACELGPPASLSRVLQASCPDEGIISRVELLLASVVYPDADLDFPVGEPFPMEVELISIPSLPAVEPGSLELSLLSGSFSESGGDAWALAYVAEGYDWGDGTTEGGFGTSLVHFDPLSGELAGHWPLPAGSQASTLLKDPHRPPILAWLVEEDDHLQRYFSRIQPSTAGFDPPTPIVGADNLLIVDGLVLDQQAWIVSFDIQEQGTLAFHSVDLETGAAVEVALPDEVDPTSVPSTPALFWMEDRIGLTLPQGDDPATLSHRLLVFDPVTERWTRVESLPVLSVPGIQQVVASSGDLLLLSAEYLLSTDPDAPRPPGGPLAWDLHEHALRLPEDPCNAERMLSPGDASTGVVRGSQGSLLAVDMIGGSDDGSEQPPYRFVRFQPLPE